jgi:hypothetical protein
MHREEETTLSDREKELIRQIAESRGITEAEAADQLMHEGVEQRFRKKLRRAPAKVYEFRRKP